MKWTFLNSLCLAVFRNRKYFSQIWIHRSVILNYGSGSGWPINYGNVAVAKSESGLGRNPRTWILINLYISSSVINQSTLNLLRVHFSYTIWGEPHLVTPSMDSGEQPHLNGGSLHLPPFWAGQFGGLVRHRRSQSPPPQHHGRAGQVWHGCRCSFEGVSLDCPQSSDWPTGGRLVWDHQEEAVWPSPAHGVPAGQEAPCHGGFEWEEAIWASPWDAGCFHQGFGSRSVTGSALIWVAGSGSTFKLRIRIQEGKNDPQK